ncbi:hypothetical protein [Sandarakinorhabdus sp.]|uniref:division/cell wall cluster transcriptional repressor MraZ n=1 Tax=Sandarakinorhabdus sp. TaxID=1916663 RepID=UPI00286E9E03|nr:hypothetical protein [Sandarakinorhabdus sp.]
MSQDFYQGYGLAAIDAKSRLLIPAGYRDCAVARSGTRDILVGIGHGADCLMAYDRSHAARLMADFKTRVGASTDRAVYDEAAFLFGSAQALALDGGGRIVLPAVLKDVGELHTHVWFVGSFDWFEIWNPWAYMARPQTHPGQVRLVKSELAARGLPLQEPAA